MSSGNKEIWKKIEDYDYIVSNFGRIKNLKYVYPNMERLNNF